MRLRRTSSFIRYFLPSSPSPSSLLSLSPSLSFSRWNRPLIVHNLLLHGAQYSALNHSHQTPLQLTNVRMYPPWSTEHASIYMTVHHHIITCTHHHIVTCTHYYIITCTHDHMYTSSQDEEVQQHIANAVTGVIDVGSYRRSPMSAPTAERGMDWTELGSQVTSTQLRGSHPAPTITTRARGMLCTPFHVEDTMISRVLKALPYVYFSATFNILFPFPLPSSPLPLSPPFPSLTPSSSILKVLPKDAKYRSNTLTWQTFAEPSSPLTGETFPATSGNHFQISNSVTHCRVSSLRPAQTDDRSAPVIPTSLQSTTLPVSASSPPVSVSSPSVSASSPSMSTPPAMASLHRHYTDSELRTT